RDRHSAADVGDEPLMMAASLPVVVSRDRAAGLALARAQDASVILMDDGFQNPSVAKNVSLIVIDAMRGVGNGRVIPAGPLRAPLSPQLARTDALVVVGEGSAAAKIAADLASRGKPVLSARLKPDQASLAALGGERVLAFAGIGDPARFFNTLRSSGVDVVRSRAFADHHAFTADEIEQLTAGAKADALTLVTTEKDLARLRDPRGMPASAQAIVPFAVTMQFDDGAALRRFVTDQLFKARDSKLRG
ncbi:MAG: tetraacyldisaccharide 4'-kinase, partial [Bradyrhizobium sp.]